MSPPPTARLAGVLAKIQRANHHIEELDGHARAFADDNRHCVVCERDPESGEGVFRIRLTAPLPGAVPLILGDAVHNLRSALDYLAWQLVLASGGNPDESTSYPLRPTPWAYKKAVRTKGTVEALPPHVRGRIEATQPYQSGYEHLGVLSILDNTDKHRLLIVAFAAARVMGLGMASVPDGPKPYTFRPTGARRGGAMVIQDGDELGRVAAGREDEVHPLLVPEIAFGEAGVVEGEPVVEFLTQLSQLVEGVVNQFDPFL